MHKDSLRSLRLQSPKRRRVARVSSPSELNRVCDLHLLARKMGKSCVGLHDAPLKGRQWCGGAADAD